MNKERITEILHEAVELPTSECSIFTVNEGLVQMLTSRERLKLLTGNTSQILHTTPLAWKKFLSNQPTQCLVLLGSVKFFVRLWN